MDNKDKNNAEREKLIERAFDLMTRLDSDQLAAALAIALEAKSA